MLLSWKRVGRTGLGCGENRSGSGFGRVRSLVSRWGSWWGRGSQGSPREKLGAVIRHSLKGLEDPNKQMGKLRTAWRPSTIVQRSLISSVWVLRLRWISYVCLCEQKSFSLFPRKRGENLPVFFPRFSPSTSFQFSVGTLRVIPVVWFQCNWAGHKNKLLHLAGFLLLSAVFRLAQKSVPDFMVCFSQDTWIAASSDRPATQDLSYLEAVM